MNYFLKLRVLLLILFLSYLAKSDPSLCQNLSSRSALPSITFIAPNDSEIKFDSSAQDHLIFNKTLVKVELQCTFSQPVTWDFSFDPYINHWTDAFWTLHSRDFIDFENVSSYVYKSILKLRFHHPIPIPQTFLCQVLSSNDQNSSYCPQSIITLDSDKEEEVISNTTVIFRLQSATTGIAAKSSPTLSPPPAEDDCKVIYWVKPLTVDKLQWKCLTVEENVSLKISYRHNWYCTTADQCRNYYSKAKKRKTCLKILDAKEECPGCITYSGLASFVMFCKTETDHWTRKVLHSLNTDQTHPNLILSESFKSEDYRNLIYFKPIPQNLMTGDEILLECQVSEFVFATSVIFAIKYSSSSSPISKFEYFKGNSSFEFKYGAQSQTYTSYYEDTTNSSFYHIPTNTRIYKRIIQLNQKTMGKNGGKIEEIFCYAPLWNSKTWIWKSHPVVLNKVRSDVNYCRFEAENPKIVILPEIPTAQFSQEDTLIIKHEDESKRWTVIFNCTFNQPIYWEITGSYYKDQLKMNHILRRKLDLKTNVNLTNSVFLSSLRLTGKAEEISPFSIKCSSLNKKCSNSIVNYFYGHANTNGRMYEGKISIFKVNPVPESRALYKTRKLFSNTCVTIFIVKEISGKNGKFLWKCVDGQQPTEQMNDVSEIHCNDHLTCRLLTQGGLIQDPVKCLQMLRPNETCENCESGPIGVVEQPNFTKYLRCDNPLATSTYQPVFKLQKSNRLYWKLPLAEEEELLDFKPISNLLYIAQNLTIICNASPQMYSQGLKIALKFLRNGIEDYIFLSEQDHFDTDFNQITIKAEINISDKSLQEIYCFAPNIFTTSWTNSSYPVTVLDSKYPEITESSDANEILFSDRESNVSLHCETSGVPTPELFWEYPETVLSHPSALESMIRTTSLNSSTLTFKTFLEIYQGTYICHSKNIIGQTSKSFYVNSKISSTVIYSKTQTGLLIGMIILVVCVVIAGTFIYWKCWHLQKVLEQLTEADIRDFFQGVPTDEKESEESSQPNREIYSQRYSTAFEIPKTTLEIDWSRVLGEGEFGVVCVGHFLKDTSAKVAVKLAKPSVKLNIFQALLSEIKVMAFVGEHENIVKFFGACTSNLKNKEVIVVMELCPCGNLQKFLYQNRDSYSTTQLPSSSDSMYQNVYENTEYENPQTFRFTLYNLVKWTHEIANACEYLEFKKVIHGDLAARNVLLTHNLTSKLSDFGLSRVLSEYSNYSTSGAECPLPWKWLALEVLTDRKFSSKSDVWAYGITTWEIFTLGEIPYPGLTWTPDFVEMLKMDLRSAKPQFATDEIYALMAECWAKNSADRPSFSDLKYRIGLILNTLQPSQTIS